MRISSLTEILTEEIKRYCQSRCKTSTFVFVKTSPNISLIERIEKRNVCIYPDCIAHFWH